MLWTGKEKSRRIQPKSHLSEGKNGKGGNCGVTFCTFQSCDSFLFTHKICLLMDIY